MSEGEKLSPFHDHLDKCPQCEQHPFDLCVVGYKLLLEEPLFEDLKFASKEPQ